MNQLDALIPTTRKLQDVFATLADSANKIELPQIVVVGAQSAGKSSVIEGIVGKSFLPRGNGIVTRTPLLLHLIYTPMEDLRRRHNGQIIATAWATFEHLPERIFTDFDQVREEIINQTNILCGIEKGITDIPINLKIYSAKVIDLSLVDLPGMTKLPVGKQPPDIEHQIKNIIMKYIKNPNSLMLVVTPANVDFATTEALKFAQKVDKDGDRTLCVLTKLDMMEKGTNALEVLNGTLIPVKLGIIGVVNRSQEDINLKTKNMQECLDFEMNFLSVTYPKIAEKHGIPYLSKTLNKLLMKHIKNCLPGLKQRVVELKDFNEERLRSWGATVYDGNEIVLNIITEFSEKYVSEIYGTSKEYGTSELCGGARICSVFHEKFFMEVGNINPTEGLSDENVLTSSRNASGVRPPLFIAEQCFDNEVKKQITRLNEPSLKCVDAVYDELVKMIQPCGKEINELQRFPRLSVRINEFISEFLSRRIELTKEFVRNLIKIEAAYINTKSPDMTLLVLTEMLIQLTGIQNDEKTKNKKDIIVDTAPSAEQTLIDRDKQHAVLIKGCIDEYFKIVKKSIQDKVPKAIMEFLVNHVTKNLNKELITAFYKCKDIDDLLVESSDMTSRRKQTKKLLEALGKANKIIGEVYETE